MLSDNYSQGQSYGASNIVSNRVTNDFKKDIGFVDPNSQTYLDWYRGINNKLEGVGSVGKKITNINDLDIKSKPTISANSHKMIEQKRYGSQGSNNAFSNSANVHNRLH